MSYILNYSGEQVDTAIGNALPLICGRETVVLEEASSGNYTSKDLSLPFTPNNNTKIIATLSKTGAPNPWYYYSLMLARMGSTIYAVISSEYGSGNTVSAGTYYIDWLVLDKGDTTE